MASFFQQVRQRIVAFLGTKPGRRVSAGIISALWAGFISWLLTAESSPLYEYFLHNTSLKNLWYLLNILPYIVSALVGGDPHLPSEFIFWLLFFVQWFVIGYIVSAGLFLITDRAKQPEPQPIKPQAF